MFYVHLENVRCFKLFGVSVILCIANSQESPLMIHRITPLVDKNEWLKHTT